MHILLTHEYAIVSGVPTWMIGLSRVFKERGHSCELFFFEHGPIERELPRDIVTHFGDLADFLRLVASSRFDVVHCAASDWQIGVAAMRRFCRGTKLVITSHGAGDRRARGCAQKLATHWISANCDALVACARWEAAEQQQWTDLPVHTVLNGIDTGAFTPARIRGSTGPPIVAWTGRGWDLKQKRLDILASIAPFLHKAGVRLRIADPGGPERAAPDVAEVLSPLVEFWGPVPRPGMAPFFQEIAASGGCLLSTSAFEGLPLALLEAQACGCPVIGPDVRGVNECVSPEHGGLLYPLGFEPNRLAALVLEALADGAAMDDRRKKCARYVHERFGESRMADHYLRIYEEAPDMPCRRAPATRGVRDYVDRYWTPGYCLHLASQRLAEAGDWGLAARTARAALSKCPTLFLRARRISHLLRTHKNWLFGRSRVREDNPLN